MQNNIITKKWKLAQTLEFKWWQHYLHNKDVANYLSWKKNYWNNLLADINDVVSLSEKSEILDAGCGPTGIFIALNKHTVTAIDPLLDKYQTLKHFKSQNYPNVTYKNIAIEALDDTEKYDYIFCLNAINHVNDIDKCYGNLVNALKPNGTLIISTDAHRSNFLKKIFQLIPGDMLHPIQLNIEEYNSFLEKRKMSILKNMLYKQESIFNYYITIAKKNTK